MCFFRPQHSKFMFRKINFVLLGLVLGKIGFLSNLKVKTLFMIVRRFVTIFKFYKKL